MKKIAIAITIGLLAISAQAYDARSYTLVPTDYSLVDVQVSNVETIKKINSSLTAEINSTIVSTRYLKYFNVAGNLGAVYVLVPYGTNDGKIKSNGATVKSEQTDGQGDIRLFFGLGMYNTPALTKEEFRTYNKDGTRASCSVALTLPNGGYSKNNTFNIGSNQTSLKPECILTYTQNKFVAEFATGLTKYSDNKDYTATSSLAKDDLYHSELHLSYNVASKMWAGVDLFYANGGKTYVNNATGKDQMDNLSAGFIMSYNVSPGGYIKFNYQKTISSPEFAPTQKGFGLAFQQLF
jgi:hypothetical protein